MFMAHQTGMTGQFPDEFVATEPAKNDILLTLTKWSMCLNTTRT